ncbi:uncharacterized protein LOC144019009 isoform X2 [Festucalex cinctus]
MLKELVRERLIAAADEIFGLFERTIASYEEQLRRAREESEQQRRQLEAISKSQLVLHIQDAQTQIGHQVQQPPPQLQGGATSSLEHPQPLHVKEEMAAVPMKMEEGPTELQQMTDTKGDHRGSSQADSLFAPLSDGDDIDELLRSGTDSEELEGTSSLAHPKRRRIKQEEEEGSSISNLLLSGALVKSEDDDDSPDWSPPRDNHSPMISARAPSSAGARVREKPLSCSVCGHRFSRKSHLAAHMRKHGGANPISCFVCGERFSSRVALIAHTVTHTVDQPLACPICAKIFSCKRNLSNHINTHREDSFNCTVCDKRFTQKVNLEWHMKTHTVQQTFSCPFCGKTFSEESAMLTHMQIHSGEKAFACPLCGRRFCVEANMLAHVKTHN